MLAVNDPRDYMTVGLAAAPLRLRFIQDAAFILRDHVPLRSPRAVLFSVRFDSLEFLFWSVLASQDSVLVGESFLRMIDIVSVTKIFDGYMSSLFPRADGAPVEP